jgi:hypothetical protein
MGRYGAHGGMLMRMCQCLNLLRLAHEERLHGAGDECLLRREVHAKSAYHVSNGSTREGHVTNLFSNSSLICFFVTLMRSDDASMSRISAKTASSDGMAKRFPISTLLS